MRRVLFLAGAIVLVDTIFFTALTPLLPHYAHALGLGKAGAGVLAAAYPAGRALRRDPERDRRRPARRQADGAGRDDGRRDDDWRSSGSPTRPGSSISRASARDSRARSRGPALWPGSSLRLRPTGEAALIGQAFAAAVGGALLGPGLGGIASVAGTGWTFGVVAAASLGVAVWAALTPAAKPDEPEGIGTLIRALGDRRIRLAHLVRSSCRRSLRDAVGACPAPARRSSASAPSRSARVWLGTAGLETVNNIWIGRLADRSGPLVPIRGALIASTVVAALLPWPDHRFELAALVVCAGLAFGSFYTPGMTLLTHAAEARGLDYGYAFALMNLAWAPGQAAGAALGGAVAEATSDAVPYLALSALALLTLVGLRRFER